MYNKIKNPDTNRWVSITTPTGKKILKKYLIQSGGSCGLSNSMVEEILDIFINACPKYQGYLCEECENSYKNFIVRLATVDNITGDELTKLKKIIKKFPCEINRQMCEIYDFYTEKPEPKSKRKSKRKSKGNRLPPIKYR